jgi:hypothetical protein
MLLSLNSTAVTLPFVRSRKWKRSERCLSVASFVRFPFFDLHKREPEGQRLRGRLSLPSFFGEAKKEGGSRAIPGN